MQGAMNLHLHSGNEVPTFYICSSDCKLGCCWPFIVESRRTKRIYLQNIDFCLLLL